MNKTSAKPRHPYVTHTSGIVGGRARIKGTRISVWLIVGWLRKNHTPEQIAKMYPHINLAQIHDAISYYYDHRDEIEKDLKDQKTENVLRKINGYIDERGFLRFHDAPNGKTGSRDLHRRRRNTTTRPGPKTRRV